MKTTEQAIENVKNGNIADYHSILSFAENWVKNQFKAFTSEELKAAYFEFNQTEIDEPRVFGAVFRYLSNNKHIYAKGSYRVSNNPICHSRPQRIWISKEFAMKQQANRKTKNLSLFPNN